MIWHPLLLAVYPVLALLEANWGQVDSGETVRPLLLSLVLAGAIWGISHVWVKAPARSALVTSLALLLLFSYGHVYQANSLIPACSNAPSSSHKCSHPLTGAALVSADLWIQGRKFQGFTLP